MKYNIFFKALVLALLVAGGGICNRAHAQYQSFFGDSITEYYIGGYYVTYDPDFFGVETYEYLWNRSDTISFNQQTYYFIPNRYGWDHYYDVNFYIREDTVTGRIYRYVPEFDLEELICDMSLALGDTFYMPYFINYYGALDYQKIPIVADSIWFENGKKMIRFSKSYLFPSLDPWDAIPRFISYKIQNVVFVEGVGPNFTPFGWHDGHDDCPGGNSSNWWGFYPILLCAHKDEELVYMADERAGCWQSPPAKIDDKERILFRLYPNPVKNSLTLQFEDGIALNGMLYITNMYGCVVHSQQVNDARMRVNVRSLSAGSYIATYFVNGKKSSVKFVKQ